MENSFVHKLLKCITESHHEYYIDKTLLNQRVSLDFSKSLVEILKLSSVNTNSKKSIKCALVENIRKLCLSNEICIEHNKVYENITSLMNFKSVNIKAHEDIECFLSREMPYLLADKVNDTDPNEMILAVLNLYSTDPNLNCYLEKVISSYGTQLNESIALKLWKTHILSHNILDTLTFVISNYIENVLLDSCFRKLLSQPFICDELNNLILKSSQSSQCFWTCSLILNNIYISSQFNCEILAFINFFIENVRNNMKNKNISLLYPLQYQKIAFYLSINYETFKTVANEIICDIFKKLKTLELDNASEFILLMSHFPYWFDCYVSNSPK